MGKTESIMLEQFAVRFMTNEDLEQVCGIEENSFPSPWSRFAFQTELNDNHFSHYFTVVERDRPQRVVGYGGMWVIVDEAHITNVAIDPAYRGYRLGELLLGEMMGVAVANSAHKMTLEVRVSNERAQRLYERVGFVSSGLRKGYYSDNKEDAMIMWCDLAVEEEVDLG